MAQKLRGSWHLTVVCQYGVPQGVIVGPLTFCYSCSSTDLALTVCKPTAKSAFTRTKDDSTFDNTHKKELASLYLIILNVYMFRISARVALIQQSGSRRNICK